MDSQALTFLGIMARQIFPHLGQITVRDGCHNLVHLCCILVARGALFATVAISGPQATACGRPLKL